VKWKPLPRAFFERSVLIVARECLGKFLIHELPTETLVARIVESEAYRGPLDRAAHSYGGKPTKRTLVMYGEAGVAYVFFVYGMHYQFNVVTGRVGEPHAVLIRAVEPILGQPTMQANRGHPRAARDVTNGPGKLCQALGIDRHHNGIDLCRPPLYFSEGPAPSVVRRSPRIGVDYAGEWALRPWRWVDANSQYASRRAAGSRSRPRN